MTDRTQHILFIPEHRFIFFYRLIAIRLNLQQFLDDTSGQNINE